MASPGILGRTLALLAAGAAIGFPANGLSVPGPAPSAPPAETTPERASNHPPSSISGTALRDELRQALDERRALQAERAELEKQRKELEDREAELARVREQMKAETARLEDLLAKRAAAEASGAPAAGAPGKPRTAGPSTPAGLAALAKTAKGMKPAEMATVLGQLEPTTAADVLMRMRPADSGAVLAALPPERAAELAAEMTRRPAPREPR
jgi:flagellar motility protein MotE (MotC chaperone)